MSATTFPFHDGYLASISVAEGEAVLGLKQADGTAYRMTLAGLQALSIDGFREGNIIMRIWSVTGKSLDADDVPTDTVREAMEILFPGPYPIAEAHYHRRHEEFLAVKLDQVAKGEAALVFIEPAYGADLLAFCSSVALDRFPSGSDG
ncbi:hypothetical protein [Phenylobacterium sp.]|uniref:hypothetical protein n=1 Tax=Phenylobacterium sp. TaxID=1871053 RepID=UPI0025D026F3|nr:hypothetical protein [Phenylobacterium sp.]